LHGRQSVGRQLENGVPFRHREAREQRQRLFETGQCRFGGLHLRGGHLCGQAGLGHDHFDGVRFLTDLNHNGHM
jgi:hypothetical protein